MIFEICVQRYLLFQKIENLFSTTTANIKKKLTTSKKITLYYLSDKKELEKTDQST